MLTAAFVQLDLGSSYLAAPPPSQFIQKQFATANNHITTDPRNQTTTGSIHRMQSCLQLLLRALAPSLHPFQKPALPKPIHRTQHGDHPPVTTLHESMHASGMLESFLLASSYVRALLPQATQQLLTSFHAAPQRLPGSFLEASWKLPGSFPEISRKFPGNFPEILFVSKTLPNGISQKLPGSFPEISRKFPGNFPETCWRLPTTLPQASQRLRPRGADVSRRPITTTRSLSFLLKSKPYIITITDRQFAG